MKLNEHRYEIDGLMSITVLSILFYHLKIGP